MPADFRNRSGHDLMAFPLDRLQPYAFLVGQLGRPQPTDKDSEGPQSQEEGWPAMLGPPQPPPPTPPTPASPASTLAHILLQLTGLGLSAPLGGLGCPYLSRSLAEEPLACKSSNGSPWAPSFLEPKLRQAPPQACSKDEDTGCPLGTQTPRDMLRGCPRNPVKTAHRAGNTACPRLASPPQPAPPQA